MAFSASGENLALQWMFTTGTPTRPTTWYLALHAGANGGSGAANELSGNGYARQAITFSVTGNVATSTNAQTFGPNTTSAWGTVTDGSIWTASTGGICLSAGTLAASVAYAVNDTATVATGATTVTLT
jgi:hypothetical protein